MITSCLVWHWLVCSLHHLLFLVPEVFLLHVIAYKAGWEKPGGIFVAIFHFFFFAVYTLWRTPLQLTLFVFVSRYSFSFGYSSPVLQLNELFCCFVAVILLCTKWRLQFVERYSHFRFTDASKRCHVCSTVLEAHSHCLTKCIVDELLCQWCVGTQCCVGWRNSQE